MANKPQRILVTGAAGFIGSHLADALLKRDDLVVAIDNFNPLYDPTLKRQNVAQQLKHPNYLLVEGDIRDRAKLNQCFAQGMVDAVVHLAALGGVRQSIADGAAYMDVNVTGTQTLIDTMLSNKCTHMVFGSSSAVYGIRKSDEFKEDVQINKPLSPYAASKAAGELLAYCAHQAHGLSAICLRFFTVFGPRQRPEVVTQKFMRQIDAGKPIEVFGDGTASRDFTYVSDVVSGIMAAIDLRSLGYEIINLGRGESIQLTQLIRELELALDKQADIKYENAHPGEMPYTLANIDKAKRLLGYNHCVSFRSGIEKIVAAYKESSCAASR